MKKLYDYIPPNVLPREYGGTDYSVPELIGNLSIERLKLKKTKNTSF